MRVRVTGTQLYEGLRATVQMPVGERVECVMVPRDAVLNEGGRFLVYTANAENICLEHEVEVLGYDGMRAGVRAESLLPGQQVIIKGHERLNNGDQIAVVESGPTSLKSATHADG